MSTDLTKPTRQAAAVAGRSAPLKVTGKLKIAIETMVWSGACRADAAKVSGLTDHSLRSALKKPHVKAAYLAELEVLRLSARARAFHRLVELSEQNDNKGAAVAFGAVASPGLTIQIISSSDAVKVAPTIEHDEGDCE
jgi:hypothetical protein